MTLFFHSALRTPTAVVFSLAAMLLAGFGTTRLTKILHLPNVTGYILAGILIGPYGLDLIPEAVYSNMDFVTDIALAFIAFGVGKFFELEVLKRSGWKICVITIFEALTAAVLVTLVLTWVFHLPLAFSLLLGAIGSATAPASTIMTIQQYRAKGEFVDTILQVVALDDAVALIAFSVCAAVVQATEGEGNVEALSVFLPLLLNVAAIFLGGAAGFAMQKLAGPQRSAGHRLVLVTAFLLLLTGFCGIWDISPLLGCMVMGMVYVNRGGNKKLFKQVNKFTPSTYLLFFVLSGMHLNVPSLAVAGVVGLAYFGVRIVGKCAGAWLGAKLSGASDAVRKYLGLALIPQAGVSIGLAMLGQRMLPGETGILLSTIILSSGVLYEMVGPASAKLSLSLSGSFSPAPGNRAADK